MNPDSAEQQLGGSAVCLPLFLCGLAFSSHPSSLFDGRRNERGGGGIGVLERELRPAIRSSLENSPVSFPRSGRGFSVARLSIIPLTSRLGLRFLLDLASVVACSLTLRFFLAFSKGKRMRCG
ncbi:IQ calmodulin-binding motif [Musa troglodytarum]|uniref:IQ calmodulin-binding motif n=1 Tax=Musa troglodytarum TaxID=320322 RepID=A0A9E7H4R2_9LILI|nr:IQ calmodulin-binding motif [Musa troglodytarum]